MDDIYNGDRLWLRLKKNLLKNDTKRPKLKVQKSLPSRTLLAIWREKTGRTPTKWCGWKELFRSFNLSTRASKTEFVCKSYGPAKFAVKTGQMSGRVGHGNGNWRKQTISSDGTAEIEVGQRLRVGARGSAAEISCRGRPEHGSPKTA